MLALDIFDFIMHRLHIKFKFALSVEGACTVWKRLVLLYGVNSHYMNREIASIGEGL
jgi:hypothetical protein